MENPPHWAANVEEIIPGTAMPVRLSGLHLDPVLGLLPERHAGQRDVDSRMGQGTRTDKSTEHRCRRGIWIPGQPDAGFGASSFAWTGVVPTCPFWPAPEQGAHVTLASDYSSHEDVRIMGAFNGWSRTASPLSTWCGWTIDLELGEGQHAYQLIVDGEEMPDPDNPERVDNGFGGFNSLLLTVEVTPNAMELAAIGFGGNQVHDVRLLGTPGARVWAWWDDHLYTASVGRKWGGPCSNSCGCLWCWPHQSAAVGHGRRRAERRSAHSPV